MPVVNPNLKKYDYEFKSKGLSSLVFKLLAAVANFVGRRKATKFRQVDLKLVSTQLNRADMREFDPTLHGDVARKIKLLPPRTLWNSGEMPALDHKLHEDSERKITLLPPRTLWISGEMPALDHKMLEDAERNIKLHALRTQWTSQEMPALKPVEKSATASRIEPVVHNEGLVQSNT